MKVSLVGQSLGRYHITEQLGEGGMATVFKAYDTLLERDVAVKVIRIDQFPPGILEQVLKRFEREAKALAKLTHPNIVHIHDFGEYENAPYLVMEYLPGGTLKSRLGTAMLWDEAIRLLLPIAQALEYAHKHGIIHRDIKPSNILLTENSQPMLTDFGIAKILESEQGTALTSTGMGIGTPEYMAPEQWTGQAGPQADLYSLGVVLYELVTGRKPYIADTPAAIMIKQINDPLPLPREYSPGLPETMEKLLVKALARLPEDRYPDMGAFVKALENQLALIPIARQLATSPAMTKPHLGDSQATLYAGQAPVTIITPEPQSLSASSNAPRIPPIPSGSSKAKSKRWLWIAGIGAGLIIGGGICLTTVLGGLWTLGSRARSTPTLIQTNTAIPTQAVLPTASKTLFTDPKVGLRLSYPTGWQADLNSNHPMAAYQLTFDSPDYTTDSSGVIQSGGSMVIFVPIIETFPFPLLAGSEQSVVDYYGTGGGDKLLPGETTHAFNLSGYPAASGEYLRTYENGSQADELIAAVLVEGEVILFEGWSSPQAWNQVLPIFDEMVRSSTVIPNALLGPMPGLAGKWIDPDSSGGGTVSTIAFRNGDYTVISVINSSRGADELTKSSWANGVLTWEYCPAGMHCITQSTITLKGDILTVNWAWTDGGNSGTSDLKRQP